MTSSFANSTLAASRPSLAVEQALAVLDSLAAIGDGSAAVREYAEVPDRFAEVPADSSVERFADERICILQGPMWASVSGVAVDADEVRALVAEVRRVPAEKEPLWWIGPPFACSPARSPEELLPSSQAQ